VTSARPHGLLTVVPTRPTPLVIDVCGIKGLDEHSLEALVRLQLTARRCGATIVLRNASRELIDLLALVGMEDVVVCASEGAATSGVDGDGEPEQREEALLDEEVEFDDPAV
jgi:anti-anti-sigma regulatory factor